MVRRRESSTLPIDRCNRNIAVNDNRFWWNVCLWGCSGATLLATALAAYFIFWHRVPVIAPLVQTPAAQTATDGCIKSAAALPSAPRTRNGLTLIYKGTSDSCKLGFQLLEEAANDKEHEAALALGQLHFEGIGVAQDIGMAAYWFRQAAEGGIACAQHNLAQLLFNGSEGVPKDRVEAVRWYERAAEGGNRVSQYNLGLMYTNGDEVPRDDAKALLYLERSAKTGFAPAYYTLGMIYFEGRGIRQDHVRARSLFQQAANQGNADGQFMLGYMCGKGLGGPADKHQTLRLMQAAASQGHPKALKVQTLLKESLENK